MVVEDLLGHGMRWIILFALAAGTGVGGDLPDVLGRQCLACHSGKLRTSGFSVESLESVKAGGSKFGRAVVGGHPDASPLVKVLNGDLSPRMPLGKKLAPAEIAAVEDWIRAMPAEPVPAKRGREWRWPFEKPVKREAPKVLDQAWVRNPIDAFLLKRLEENSLRPAPAAPKRVLARRLYFDLIGMPPSPEEMEAFLADGSPDAYEKLIDKLLADPRYGERWGRHWLDLVRYGETSGLEGDGSIGNAWRYRDWVIQAFNEDMPYDRFVTLQLGGADEHSKTRNNYPPDLQGHIPLGFLRVAPWDRSNLVAEEVRQNYLSEVTTAAGSIFLGLSLGCARCHDHKYDPIPMRDFYRMQAFFQAVQVENVTVPYKDKAFAARAEQKIKEYEERLKDGPEKKALDDFERSMLAKLIAARKAMAGEQELKPEDLRLEIRREPSKLFTEAERQRHADLLEDANRTQDPEERAALDGFEKQLLVKLKEAYASALVDPLTRFDQLKLEDARAELGRETSKVFTAEEREKHRALSNELEVLRRRLGRWRPEALTVGNVPGPPAGPMIAPARILNRGDYRQPGEEVHPGFPSAITGNSEPAVLETDRYRQFPTRGWRMTLARWMAGAENPLAARVMANRIWQHHFGAGIVATPNDFGANGARPTHPELLDWLAVTFREQGWSVKQMHRLMLTSNAYRQSSDNPAMQQNTVDPENRLLWRMNRRRLEAEAIRDSILFMSGRLNREMGGPSVFPPLPEDLADFARYGRTGGLMWEPSEKEEDARRRSVYIFQRRSLPLPMMASFDALPFSESCERRSVTTTPLQALSMMNGDLVHEEAAHLARRARREAAAGLPAQVVRAFQIVMNREPSPEELARFAEAGGGLEAASRVLLNSNEFLYVD